MPTPLEGKLTPAQAAERLGVSATRVRQLLKAGRLAYHATPVGKLIDPADVERLAAEQAGEAAR